MNASLQLNAKMQLFGRIFLYSMVVYLFHQVFNSVQAGADRTWYLAITEWLILSSVPISLQIEQDIRSGQIVYFILKPVHYISLRLSDGAGVFFVRFLLLGITCILLGYSLTGVFPSSMHFWWVGTLFGIMGMMLYHMIMILIGILSFWLKEIQGLIYLNLTATFCFGGLIVPLDFYSPLVRNISFCTPYPWILWWPAEMILGKPFDLTIALLSWSVWMILFIFLTALLYRQCLKAFVVEGG